MRGIGAAAGANTKIFFGKGKIDKKGFANDELNKQIEEEKEVWVKRDRSRMKDNKESLQTPLNKNKVFFEDAEVDYTGIEHLANVPVSKKFIQEMEDAKFGGTSNRTYDDLFDGWKAEFLENMQTQAIRDDIRVKYVDRLYKKHRNAVDMVEKMVKQKSLEQRSLTVEEYLGVSSGKEGIVLPVIPTTTSPSTTEEPVSPNAVTRIISGGTSIGPAHVSEASSPTKLDKPREEEPESRDSDSLAGSHNGRDSKVLGILKQRSVSTLRESFLENRTDMTPRERAEQKAAEEATADVAGGGKGGNKGGEGRPADAVEASTSERTAMLKATAKRPSILFHKPLAKIPSGLAPESLIEELDVEVVNDPMATNWSWFKRVAFFFRWRVWLLMSEPDTSTAAYIISIFILMVIMLSSVTFCMETMEQYEDDDSVATFEKIEIMSVTIFTAEYLLKFVTSPNTWEFVKGTMNVIDLVAILPFYVEIAVAGSGVGNTRILRIMRLVRVFRVLKLGGRYGKMQIVVNAVRESLDMLMMMLFLLILGIVLFSTLIYFCEKGELREEYGEKYYVRPHEQILTDLNIPIETPFKSIPDSFWWCMVTLMTVGYGDIYPITTWGKIVAALAMLASVLFMALPISVIATHFGRQWADYIQDKSYNNGDTVDHALNYTKLLIDVRTHLSTLVDLLKEYEEEEDAILMPLMRLEDWLLRQWLYVNKMSQMQQAEGSQRDKTEAVRRLSLSRATQRHSKHNEHLNKQITDLEASIPKSDSHNLLTNLAAVRDVKQVRGQVPSKPAQQREFHDMMNKLQGILQNLKKRNMTWSQLEVLCSEEIKVSMERTIRNQNMIDDIGEQDEAHKYDLWELKKRYRRTALYNGRARQTSGILQVASSDHSNSSELFGKITSVTQSFLATFRNGSINKVVAMSTEDDIRSKIRRNSGHIKLAKRSSFQKH